MIIGIAGQMESGKSAVTNILAKKFEFREVAFADNLKEMCIDVFQLDPPRVYSTEGKALKFGIPIEIYKDNLRKIRDWAEEKNGYTITYKHVNALKTFEGFKLYSGREVLQIVGTEICRLIFHPDYHAKALFDSLGDIGNKNIAISDARFQNERDMIRERGGINVLVKCAGQPDSHGTHASENSLGDPKNYDFVLYNDKTKGLEYLEEKVVQMYNELKNR